MDLIRFEYQNKVFICDNGSTFIEYTEYNKDQNGILQANTNYFNSDTQIKNVEQLKNLVYKNFK